MGLKEKIRRSSVGKILKLHKSEYYDPGDDKKVVIKTVYLKAKILWDNVEPEYIAHLLGITLNGLTGEEAKRMLYKKKVWPYYYPDLSSYKKIKFDQYPLDLMLPEFLPSPDKEYKKKRSQ